MGVSVRMTTSLLVSTVSTLASRKYAPNCKQVIDNVSKVIKPMCFDKAAFS